MLHSLFTFQFSLVCVWKIECFVSVHQFLRLATPKRQIITRELQKNFVFFNHFSFVFHLVFLFNHFCFTALKSVNDSFRFRRLLLHLPSLFSSLFVLLFLASPIDKRVLRGAHLHQIRSFFEHFLTFHFQEQHLKFFYISLSGKACAGDILDPLDTKLRKTVFSLSKRTLSSCFCSNPRNTNVIPKRYHQIRFSNFSQLSAAQNVK